MLLLEYTAKMIKLIFINLYRRTKKRKKTDKTGASGKLLCFLWVVCSFKISGNGLYITSAIAC